MSKDKLDNTDNYLDKKDFILSYTLVGLIIGCTIGVTIGVLFFV